MEDGKPLSRQIQACVEQRIASGDAATLTVRSVRVGVEEVTGLAIRRHDDIDEFVRACIDVELRRPAVDCRAAAGDGPAKPSTDGKVKSSAPTSKPKPDSDPSSKQARAT